METQRSPKSDNEDHSDGPVINRDEFRTQVELASVTEWNNFWSAADNKPRRRRKKPLTVEESRRRERLRKFKYVVNRIKEGKPVHQLLNNHSYAAIFTELDLDRLVLRYGSSGKHSYAEIFTKVDLDRLLLRRGRPNYY